MINRTLVITVHGDRSQTRDFVFVEDVVRATIAAMEPEQVGEAYNNATGTSISIRDLAEFIQKQRGHLRIHSWEKARHLLHPSGTPFELTPSHCRTGSGCRQREVATQLEEARAAHRL